MARMDEGGMKGRMDEEEEKPTKRYHASFIDPLYIPLL